METENIIKSWEDFEKKLRDIDTKYQDLKNNSTPSFVSEPLYRGQSNSEWELDTTLDRIEKNYSVKKYLGILRKIKPVIERCTTNRWELSPIEEDLDTLPKMFRDNKISNPTREFMIYLRHYGFPSPLLDWTRSPYIAAYFAVNEVFTDKNNREVDHSFYSFIKYCGEPIESIDGRKLCSISIWPNTIPGERQTRQKAEYTFCKKKDGSKERVKKGYVFENHESMLSPKNTNQDCIKKYILPNSLRDDFLYKLNLMNINSYTLFENEEGLMGKLANENFLSKFLE